MCSPVRCARCQKVTWAGCGEHIQEALTGFTAEQLCSCDGDLSTWLPTAAQG